MSLRIRIVDCTAVESGCLHGNFEKWKLPCKSPVPTALSFMPGLTSAFQSYFVSQIPFHLHHFYPFLLSLRPYNVRTHYVRHIFSKICCRQITTLHWLSYKREHKGSICQNICPLLFSPSSAFHSTDVKTIIIYTCFFLQFYLIFHRLDMYVNMKHVCWKEGEGGGGGRGGWCDEKCATLIKKSVLTEKGRLL